MSTKRVYELVTIATSGKVTVEQFAKRPTLEPLQKAVGGLIEGVRVRWDGKVREAYVNEEGLLHGLQPNAKARQIAAEFGYDYLVGPIAIIVPKQVKI